MTSHPIPARGETTPTCIDCGSAVAATRDMLWSWCPTCRKDVWNGEPAASPPVEPETPDTRPVRDGLDDSPILPFPPGFDPATRLPVEPADASAILKRYAGMLAHAEEQCAALTAEVSALREAVDTDTARLDWLEKNPKTFPLHHTAHGWYAYRAADLAPFGPLTLRAALDAARRDGAP